MGQPGSTENIFTLLLLDFVYKFTMGLVRYAAFCWENIQEKGLSDLMHQLYLGFRTVYTVVSKVWFLVHWKIAGELQKDSQDNCWQMSIFENCQVKRRIYKTQLGSDL